MTQVVDASEELLIDILQMLGVDFIVREEGHDEYHLCLDSN
jgi:hypothetical protein